MLSRPTTLVEAMTVVRIHPTTHTAHYYVHQSSPTESDLSQAFKKPRPPRFWQIRPVQRHLRRPSSRLKHQMRARDLPKDDADRTHRSDPSHALYAQRALPDLKHSKTTTSASIPTFDFPADTPGAASHLLGSMTRPGTSGNTSL